MIKIKHLKKTYGRIDVLKDISLDIQKGSIVTILGPSGSGKSTLLRSINMLEIPTEGNIYINGQEITRLNKKQCLKMRENVGMVFQHFNLFPNMTVIDNITFAVRMVKKLKKIEAEEKAIELLEKVGLKDKKDIYPSKLSGGQKQRVAIARALAMEPEIMLFDEPTSALDPEMVKEVLDVINKLKESGMTMVLVTHEMNFARDISDRILFLNEGYIIEDTDPDTFFTKPSTERARSFLSKVL